MSRILVLTHPEYGHTLPLIPILERLQQSGHDIVVLTVPKISSVLLRKGFEVDYWMESPDDHQRTTPQSGYSFWYHLTRELRIPTPYVILRRLEAAVRRHKPDYFILDSLFVLDFGIDSTKPPLCGRVTFIGITLPPWKTSIPKLLSPLLYLCPPEFEVPQFLIRDPMVYYVEPSCSQPFDSEIVDSASHRPMVLTAFGTQSSLQTNFLEKVNAISSIASNHRDIDFVIGLGECHLKVLQRLACRIAENVTVHTRIPQRSLLERASAFITHGGLSSIKEAIMLGVPMIITPEVLDQPFNAMRAVYHGLSSAVFPDEMNVERIEGHLDAILNCSIHSEKIAWFREVFLRSNENPVAANLIEEQIAYHCS
jgi:UDP:flavonoid glycosyltransferase YjiC (YdhE family)